MDINISLGVNPNNEHQNHICWKKIQLHAQHLLTILEREREKGSFYKSKNLHFDLELDIHTNFENYEEMATNMS